jgi:2',3'-cyclic-nucleotide 2'-phosphodiesterase (5'-nucleotidase family)
MAPTRAWLRALWWRRLSLLAALVACGPSPAPKVDPASLPASDTPVVLTVLFTSDEHGWLQPYESDETVRGGAARFLLQLVRQEKHCVGALPPAPLPDCRRASSVLLSGGDNYTGPAISTFFKGETMAAAMRRLGYSASALGNHEFDFGRERFRALEVRAGFPYLAANVRRADGKPSGVVEPYAIVERRGVRLGVVGAATVSTPIAAMAYRFADLRFEEEEQALDRIIPQVWRRGVDAVVLLIHECHDRVAPMIARNPEWRLSFVGTGHCHETKVELVGGVPLIAPGMKLSHYGRVRLSIDRKRPSGRRASLLDHELVEVAGPARDPSADVELDRTIAGWAREVDAVLGERIGFTKTGLQQSSDAIGHWIVNAWRERFGVDVAFTNRGGIRQGLPAGPIRLAHVTSVMPFENDLVLFEIGGDVLARALQRPSAIYVLAEGGARIDPARRYRAVTTDFLFYGGDGYDLEAHASATTPTGIGWRDPVIEWTRARASSDERALEDILAAPSPEAPHTP